MHLILFLPHPLFLISKSFRNKNKQPDSAQGRNESYNFDPNNDL